VNRKALIIGGGVFLVLCVLVAAVAGYFWYTMGQPLYKPGMVREGKTLRVIRDCARKTWPLRGS
jgi:hypothetical protein